MGVKVDYRRKAEECRARAKRAERPEGKAAWIRLAEDWEKFASSMEDFATRWSNNAKIV